MEEIQSVMSYIDENMLAKGQRNYNRTTQSKSIRFYLAFYMRHRLGMPHQEIASAFNLVNKKGDLDHASSIHWVKRWGELNHYRDVLNYTEEVRFLFPVNGSSSFQPGLCDRVLKSNESINKEIYIKSLGGNGMMTMKDISDILSVSKDQARNWTQDKGIKLLKIEKQVYYYSKPEVLRAISTNS